MAPISKLEIQIQNLIKLILDCKKFQFERDDIQFKHDELVRNSIITLQRDKWTIAKYKEIDSKILDEFVERFKHTWSDDVVAFTTLLNSISSFFGDNVLMGRSAFQDAVLKHGLLRFAENGGNLFEYAKSLSLDGGNLYTFSKSLGDCLSDLTINVDNLIELLSWLTEKIKVKDPGVMDGNVASIASAIRKLVTNKPTVGEKLFDRCINSEEIQLEPYHGAILVGLIDTDLVYLDKILPLLSVPRHQHTAVVVLQSSKYEDQSVLENFIKQIENVKEPSEHYWTELPRFYTSMIGKVKDRDSVIVDHCFEKLKILSQNENSKLGPNVMFHLRFLEGRDEAISEVVNQYIRQSDFDLSQCSTLSDIFYRFTEVRYYFDVIRYLAIKFKSKFPFGDFSSMGSILLSKYREDSDKELLNMLADDYGEIRHVAIRLLSQLNITGQKKILDYNILRLSAITQYKICLSVCEGFHQPDLIIPIIAPLLRSPHELVRDLIVHRLEIMTESYGAEVLDELNLLLQDVQEQERSYLNRIDQYLKTYNSEIDKKWGIKELDPRNTQYQFLKQYSYNQDRSWRENMDKNKDPNSISAMLTTVILAKGGGYKVNDSSKVSKLSMISTKMTIPREYIIAPELYDFQNGHRILENWKGKFDEWEAVISS